MNEYEITIVEMLERKVKIKANDYTEALLKVKKEYGNAQIVLDSSDYIETEFK